VWVGGHLKARVWEEEAADVRKAGMDVFPDILQFLMLVLFHLNILIAGTIANVRQITAKT